MTFSSFELSEELYKLTGWNPGEWAYDTSYADKWLRYIADFPADTRERQGIKMIPAYSLDFLLRKLPMLYNRGVLLVAVTNTDKWSAEYYSFYPDDRGAKSPILIADTPEDAAAKLCMELSKQGVFKRVNRSSNA
jgi:hypothetical protein